METEKNAAMKHDRLLPYSYEMTQKNEKAGTAHEEGVTHDHKESFQHREAPLPIISERSFS